MAELYLALITCTIVWAIRRWVALLGWIPSQLNAKPNGLPLAPLPLQLVAAVLGKIAT